MDRQLSVKGYIHNVTATSKSGPESVKCFNFLLQVSESRKRRGVCYDPSLKKWLSCWKCRRQLSRFTSTSATILKCSKCNTVQPVSSCTTKASVRIAVRDNKYELIWLKAFTTELEEMLKQPAPDVTLQSCAEEIYEQLFDLRNITLEYSKSCSIINGVFFES